MYALVPHWFMGVCVYELIPFDGDVKVGAVWSKVKVYVYERYYL